MTSKSQFGFLPPEDNAEEQKSQLQQVWHYITRTENTGENLNFFYTLAQSPRHLTLLLIAMATQEQQAKRNFGRLGTQVCCGLSLAGFLLTYIVHLYSTKFRTNGTTTFGRLAAEACSIMVLASTANLGAVKNIPSSLVTYFSYALILASLALNNNINNHTESLMVSRKVRRASKSDPNAHDPGVISEKKRSWLPLYQPNQTSHAFHSKFSSVDFIRLPTTIGIGLLTHEDSINAGLILMTCSELLYVSLSTVLLSLQCLQYYNFKRNTDTFFRPLPFKQDTTNYACLFFRLTCITAALAALCITSNILLNSHTNKSEVDSLRVNIIVLLLSISAAVNSTLNSQISSINSALDYEENIKQSHLDGMSDARNGALHHEGYTPL